MAMRSSWGCVQRLDRDRYRIRYWADTGDGYRRRTETVRGTRREADARLAELRTIHEREPGQHVRRPTGVTVGDAWRLWHAPDCEARFEAGQLARSTWDNAKGMWRRYVEPRWGGVRCDAVTAPDIQEWVRPMTSVNAHLSKMLLAQLLDRAMMYGACAANPARLKVTMPRGGERGDAGVYTLTELGEVLRAVHGSPVEEAVILMAFGSCRVGEAFGVEAGDVTLREALGVPVATVPVLRQVLQGGQVTERLKNSQSRRVVAIPGPVGARLARLSRARLEEGDPWLCGDGVGGPLTRYAAARLWAEALERAGIVRHPLRNLRNSWETYMHWTLLVEPSMIERMMGHAGKTVTARHYDRPVEDMVAEVVARAYLTRPFADSWEFLGHD